MSNFESLVAVAESHPIVGWDFSWLDDRLTTTSLNWSYEEFVVDLVKGSPNMLDMDTGGGEWLSGLPKRSPMTVATESWPPNTPVAAKRLKPFGISVVQVEPAPDNSEQTPSESRGRLPFADEFFHLITNRHASFLASEVSRVLARGGTFITQQLGCEGSYAEVFEALEVSPPAPSRPWNLGEAVRQVEGSGLRVTGGDEGVEVAEFADVGALIWYLKAIPWIVPGFESARYRDRLEELHRKIEHKEPFRLSLTGFWLKAEKG